MDATLLTGEKIKFKSFDEIVDEDFYNEIIKLYCHGNNLTSLPELPNSLTNLWCYDNNLTSLAKLPNSLITLSCFGNKLTSLPELPNSLINIDCDNNNLTSLPELPNSLTTLFCDSNNLTSLPASLLLCRNLIDIYYTNNEIVLTLPQMRFLERINNRTIDNTLYNDSQNVHNHNVQLSLIKSINTLMAD